MKVTKLILGIIIILIALLIFSTAKILLIGNALSDNTDDGYLSGFLVAPLMIAGGIIMIVTHKHIGHGGDIAGLVIFVISTLICQTMAGDWVDMSGFYKWLNLFYAIFNMIKIIIPHKNKSDEI